MPITTSPFTMNNVSITLGLDSLTAVEYKCQLQRAELVPSAGTAGGGGATYETFCDTFSGGGSSNATWTLELSGFQAYTDASDLANFLFDHEGETLYFSLFPMGGTVGADNPRFTGQVTATPTNVGGTANQYAQFTVSLPTIGKPVRDVTPVGTEFELVG